MRAIRQKHVDLARMGREGRGFKDQSQMPSFDAAPADLIRLMSLDLS